MAKADNTECLFPFSSLVCSSFLINRFFAIKSFAQIYAMEAKSCDSGVYALHPKRLSLNHVILQSLGDDSQAETKFYRLGRDNISYNLDVA